MLPFCGEIKMNIILSSCSPHWLQSGFRRGCAQRFRSTRTWHQANL